MMWCEWKMKFILLAGFVAVGCAQMPAEETVAVHPDLVACEDPRPQICTAIYDPVCALKTDDSYQTYASGCTACGDANVSGYRSGACE